MPDIWHAWQIRGGLSGFSQQAMYGRAFQQCTACSPAVIQAFQDHGWNFVLQALQVSCQQSCTKIECTQDASRLLTVILCSKGVCMLQVCIHQHVHTSMALNLLHEHSWHLSALYDLHGYHCAPTMGVMLIKISQSIGLVSYSLTSYGYVTGSQEPRGSDWSDRITCCSHQHDI